MTPQDRVYQGFSVAFDASVEEVWAAFAIGGTLVVAPEEISRSPLDVADFITANEITYFSTVPTFLALIERDLPTVRLLVLGGEACMPELVARWATPERRMLNTYGPTEATVVATWAECLPGEAVTIGRALPGYQAYVLDEQLNPVGPGSEGELFIGGAGVALGYLNRPELTAERFIDNPVQLPGGPARPPVPHPRHGAPHARRPPAVPRPHRRPGEDPRLPRRAVRDRGRADGVPGRRARRPSTSSPPAACPRWRPTSSSTRRRARSTGPASPRCCAAACPSTWCRSTSTSWSSLPTLTSGKVDRKQLPAPVNLLKGTDRQYVAPAGDLEQAVVAVWEECFHTSPVSVEDDFFLDLGGHSLLAAQVVTELQAPVRHVPRSPCATSTRTGRCGRWPCACAISASSIGAPTEQADADDAPTEAEQVFATVPAWERWLCVGLQAIAVMAIYGIVRRARSPIGALMTVAVMVRAASSFDTALWLDDRAGLRLLAGRCWPSASPSNGW